MMNDGDRYMRISLLWGGVFMLTGVVLGAFGAHALKALLSENQLVSFNTGVRYQMVHGLALLIFGLVSKLTSITLKWSVNSLIVGTLCFSMSIYFLVLGHAWNWSWVSFLGPITPLGGTFLIIGWAIFIAKVIKIKV
jgi:uncharacterized membrane protein YgdD (TMEM256/DUF423 family)